MNPKNIPKIESITETPIRDRFPKAVNVVQVRECIGFSDYSMMQIAALTYYACGLRDFLSRVMV